MLTEKMLFFRNTHECPDCRESAESYEGKSAKECNWRKGCDGISVCTALGQWGVTAWQNVRILERGYAASHASVSELGRGDAPG